MGHQPKLLTPESVALIYSPIQSWTLSPGQEAALWNAFGDGGREGWDLMRVGYLLLLSPTISLSLCHFSRAGHYGSTAS